MLAVRPVETWIAEAPGDPIRAADRILFDNGRGGTGETFDWSRIAGRPELPRALLAGGIGAHNARAAAGARSLCDRRRFSDGRHARREVPRQDRRICSTPSAPPPARKH